MEKQEGPTSPAEGGPFSVCQPKRTRGTGAEDALGGSTVTAMELGDLVVGTAHVCGPDATLGQAAQVMRDAGHGSLGVVEGGRLIGLLTERDIVGAVADGCDIDDVVRNAMAPEPDVFAPSVDVFEAALWLLESGYRHLPVVEGGRLLGVVSVTNVLAAVLDSLEEEE